MRILYLSWRNMLSKPHSTALVVLLMTLGIGLISVILQVSGQIEGHFNRNVKGIDMVVGAKGSPLQLILASVYHIDNPTGNISLSAAAALKRDRLVAQGIPLSYGDTYEGFRIVGTTDEYPSLYEAGISEGRLWEGSGEVTLGYEVARAHGLSLGDEIVSAHGLVEGGEMHGDHGLTVVGIFEQTGSVLDQLILTALESVWEIHDHEAEPTPDSARQITAMLVKFRGPMGIIRLPRMINQNTNMQAALPAFEINKLIGMMGVGIDALRALGILIMLVSGISVFISLYNAMRERRYEMALMRAYGASRWQLILLVVGEGVLLVLLGYVLGMVLGRGSMWALSDAFGESFHYALGSNTLVVEEVMLGLAAIALGLLAALVPAVQSARIRISEILAEA